MIAITLGGEFVSEQGIVDGDDFQRQNDLFYQQYQQGQLDIDGYLHFALAPLKDQGSRRSKGHGTQQFMATKIAPMLQAKAEQLVNKHRAQGDSIC